MKNDYCVIGAGRFGNSIIETLNSYNCKVLVIEINDKKIDAISDIIYAAVRIDATNFHALKSAGIEDMDTIIVGINDLKASVLTCVNVLDIMNKYPDKKLIAKASDIQHARVLRSIGVNNVIISERESGRKIALKCIYNLALDITEISNDHVIIKCRILNQSLNNVSLIDLKLRENYNANVIAITRNNQVKIPQASDVLQLYDELIFIVRTSDSKKLYNFITDKGRIKKKLK